MLKNAYSLEKNCKKLPQRRGLRPRIPSGFRRMETPPPDPRVIAPAYYDNFVKFLCSTKCVLLLSKKEQILLLPHFCAYFSLQTL